MISVRLPLHRSPCINVAINNPEQCNGKRIGKEVRMDDQNIAPHIDRPMSEQPILKQQVLSQQILNQQALNQQALNQQDINQQDINQQDLHRKLGIVDHKCSALLELSSVVLALNIIPAVSGNLTDIGSKLSAIISIAFLISSLLSLFVLWIDWAPSQETLVFRTLIYRICIFLTAIGLTAIAALMLTALNLFG